LVQVDGTKMKVSGQVLKHNEEMRKRTMILKVPKNVTTRSNSAGSGGSSAASKRRRAGTVEHCDYLKGLHLRFESAF
jgi:transcription initiation factor TFIID subunit 1